jgi:hypothetical protein
MNKISCDVSISSEYSIFVDTNIINILAAATECIDTIKSYHTYKSMRLRQTPIKYTVP